MSSEKDDGYDEDLDYDEGDDDDDDYSSPDLAARRAGSSPTSQ